MIRRYDFKCNDCNTIFEQFVDETERTLDCPKCESTAERIISPVPTKFKGFGWGGQDLRWARAHEKAAKKN